MYLTVLFLLALLGPNSLSFPSCQKGLCRLSPAPPTAQHRLVACFPEIFGPHIWAGLHQQPASSHQSSMVQLQQAAFWVTQAWKGTQGLQNLSYPSSCSLMRKAGVFHHTNQSKLSSSVVCMRVSSEPPCSRQANHQELIIF